MGIDMYLRDLKLGSSLLFVVVDLRTSEQIAVTTVSMASV